MSLQLTDWQHTADPPVKFVCLDNRAEEEEEKERVLRGRRRRRWVMSWWEVSERAGEKGKWGVGGQNERKDGWVEKEAGKGRTK